jgi:hypothetical protein
MLLLLSPVLLLAAIDDVSVLFCGSTFDFRVGLAALGCIE